MQSELQRRRRPKKTNKTTQNKKKTTYKTAHAKCLISFRKAQPCINHVRVFWPAYLYDDRHDKLIVGDASHHGLREGALGDGLGHPADARRRRRQLDGIRPLDGHRHVLRVGLGILGFV